MSIRLSSRSATDIRLSPSVFKERVSKLIDKTLDSLCVIWQEAGYEDAQCQMLLGDIFSKLDTYCATEISAEEQILTHAKEQVNQRLYNLYELSCQLGRKAPDSADKMGSNVADKLAELERQISEISIEVAERDKLLQIERQKIDHLVKILGEINPDDSIFAGPKGTPSLSDIRLNLMRQHVATLEQTKVRHEQEIKTLAQECHKYLTDLVVSEEGLGTTPESDKYSKYDLAVITLFESNEYTFGYHQNDIYNLQERVRILSREKERRREELKKTGEEIGRLWTLLRIPSSERQAFKSSVEVNLSTATIAKGREELSRLVQMRSQYLGRVIENIRIDIATLWEEIGIDTDELRRAEFPSFFDPVDILEDSSVSWRCALKI